MKEYLNFKKNQKTKILYNISNKSEHIFLFVTGLKVIADDTIFSDNDYIWENIFASFFFDSCGISTATFDWYCSSKENTKTLPTYKRYSYELEKVVKHLKTKYKKISIVSTSWGSLPIISLLEKKYEFNKIIFLGPVFNSVAPHLKSRVNNADSFFNKELKLNKKEVNKIYKSYSIIEKKKFKISDPTKILVLFGEFESAKAKEDIFNFCKNNKIKKYEIEKAGHVLTHKAPNISEKEYNKRLENMVKKMIFCI